MKVEELERLHEAATPGPWNHLGYCGQDGNIHGPRQTPIVRLSAGVTSAETGHQCYANAALIAALRNALPDIIVMARERDSYKAALEPFAKSGELLARIGDAGDFWAYRPAGGDEYGITGRHLLDAYTALERRGSQ